MDRAPIERFVSFLSADGDCWRWNGATAGGGYGVFSRAPGQRVQAHRWSYEFHVADIPMGLDIDHLCRNRWCVNPWHLEPVTRAVNTERGEAHIRQAQAAANRTTCLKRGHPFSGPNLGIRKNGVRFCRECERITKAARRARRTTP